MEAQLATSKRLLTRYNNKLEQVLTRFKQEQLELLQVKAEEASRTNTIECVRRLEEAVGAIETITSKIEQLLREFPSIATMTAKSSAQSESEIEEYTLKSEEALSTAFDYVVILHARINSFKSCDSLLQQQVFTSHSAVPTTIPALQTKQLELPTLPIPKFGGNIWEWDNFWELFNANVHSQDLPQLYKFNYLLNALKGEALESVKKFQVSNENYDKAVRFLQHRYGNSEELIHRLIDRLDHSVLRSQSVKDQRILFEQIQVIIQQLAQKGEQVDSQWIIRKILSKFPEHIQRKVVTKKRGSTRGTAFSMNELLDILEEIISCEEMMSLYVEEPPKKPQVREKWQGKLQSSFTCMYCKENHKPFFCNKYKSPQERSQYLREKKLCLLCASSDHKTTQCRRRACFQCQGLHHTSCCFKLTAPKREARTASTSPMKTTPNERRIETKDKKPTKTFSKVHHVANLAAENLNAENEGATILEVQSAQEQGPPATFLPTGQASVLDPVTKTLRKIQVLLDTGAEISFIDNALAEELRLPTVSEKQLRLHTFGSNQIHEKKCRQVELPIWDNEGVPHVLKLFTHDILTKTFAAPTLQEKDWIFIKHKKLSIDKIDNTTDIKPLVLIGCDQVWQFLRHEQHIRLPSGLYILPTHLGSLITGQIQPSTGVLPIQVCREPKEKDKWDKYWTLEAQVNTISTSSETYNDEELWERFWTLEAEGTQEFGRTEKEEKTLIDKQVWEQFNKTIERRSDGYYVRLPWKDTHQHLPDNKAIAIRRLVSVWNSLQKDESLLDQYNSVFQDQLQVGILEEVTKAESKNENQVHYIPHQAVITPHKTTTKLRIVFDASAHYKDCPSLNDVLHRGPVILPHLFGILLRFRIGQIGIISDVEKAFLQVRLHEADRDATRCLWLWDHKQPPAQENIRTLRFTRVTFGINTSPFLLAATTHFHLDMYTSEHQLAEEIKENLYVDNVILTAETLDDSLHKYVQSKEIFNQLSMNLREFVSNDKALMAEIGESDKSSDLSPKVLGIKWNSSTDKLQVRLQMSDHSHLSKRIVASALATVYDPLGWMIPLTHKVKVFLQSLWKAEYDWDNKLSTDHQKIWKQISEEIDGFHKDIPRHIANRDTDQVLVTFADASNEAMASCIYLCSSSSTNLLMARAKLPSLKGKMTMPKMEMNATTLALRLTNAVLSQIISVVKIREAFVFSDSEIVLSWIKADPPKETGAMISNRIKEIKKIVEHLQQLRCQVHFGYVPSHENPADCGTRGLDKTNLFDHMWWKGPEFLKKPKSHWCHKGRVFNLKEDSSETKPFNKSHQVTAVTETNPQVSRTQCLLDTKQASTFTKAKRIMAYVLRFVRVLLSRIRRNSAILRSISPNLQNESLNGSEIAIAGIVLIRNHQTSSITPTIIQSLHKLNIGKDNEGLLRCFGRIGKSELKLETKYPILILQKSPLARMIIHDLHDKGHPGINHTMSRVRQQFWIPQLRSQVTQHVRQYIQCQKFNNLPYKYPEQTDLPKERVTKARPFEHVGLDYFGPLQITSVLDTPTKCYGTIITCMVTRLIHLDIVSDQSTFAFLQMLRRFFARRGIPRTITSDNSPTFLLGENILRDCHESSKNDATISRELSDREILWRHITPFAPWQGGFYERLIKSVKHSLHKTLGKNVLSFEELSTVIIEIEGLLNTRPLLYMDSTFDPVSILRPIDFLQRDMQVSYPLQATEETHDDPSYVPPEDIPFLRTKTQTIQALQTSCKYTDKFWHTWQTQYLTSLREKHERQVGKKRSNILIPKKGTLVLIFDEVLPRHSWKMGRIEQLSTNAQGITREALVRMPSQRLIKRPINLLIPLEIEENVDSEDTHIQEETMVNQEDTHLDDYATNSHHRYNLRPRKDRPMGSSQVNQVSTFLGIAVICSLLGSTMAQATVFANISRSIRCIKGGVQLFSPSQVPYEICAENVCSTFEHPQVNQSVKFPPQVVLHKHDVQWKFTDKDTIQTVDITCPPAPFCEHLDCTICSAVIFNPECWPVGAIIATTVVLYFVITGCYVFLYVPLVVGRPIRTISSIVMTTIRWIISKFCNILTLRQRRRSHRRDLIELLAITTIAITTHSQACQQVDIFSHSSTVCRQTQDAKMCTVQLSEILKINPFKRETCFRLLKNNNSIHEIRASWKSLVLTCEPETDLFTRDTVSHVIDSKRCPHSGSCVGDKCAAVNSSSLIPELEEGNKYPGNTWCVESCGGPGCDCFYLSSGCLFYRTYLVPKTPQVFKIFHCNRWKEAAKVQFTHVDSTRRKSSSVMVEMIPNVPIKWNIFSLTLSTITIPPTPLLQTPFITDGNSTALWNTYFQPALRCDSFINASSLSCSVIDKCKCYPAETKANCKCEDINISTWFKMLRNQLPAVFPSLTFRRTTEGTINAIIPSMTTSEIVITLQDDLKTDIIVDDAICTATAEPLLGCYSCAKGANAQVTCRSNSNTQAEIVCNSLSFSVPCNTTGIVSTLRFSFERARIHQVCSVSCGKLPSSFEIGGILKYAHTTDVLIQKWLQSENGSTSDFQWPDFFHIAQVFLQWYKTLIVSLCILLAMVGITYIVLSTCGLRIFWSIVKQVVHLFRHIFQLFFRVILWTLSFFSCTARHHKSL